LRHHIPFLSVRENSGCADITNYNGNFSRYFPGCTSVSYGHEIRAFTRAQDPDAVGCAFQHGLQIQRSRAPEQAETLKARRFSGGFLSLWLTLTFTRNMDRSEV
jgi:hypothetical protein